MGEKNSLELKNKYNNGTPMSIKDLSEDEIEIAMHIWAEGSKNLEKVLKEGYKNGIMSLACCAGGPEPHSIYPYIRFTLDTDKSRKIAVYVAKQLIDSGLDCEIEFIDNFMFNEWMPDQYPTKDLTDFDIYTLVRNREEVFGKMFEILREIEKVDLNEIRLPTDKKQIPNQKFKPAEIVKNAIEQGLEEGITIGEVHESDWTIERLTNEHELEQGNWPSMEEWE